MVQTLNLRALRHALTLRDLSDSEDGVHAMQLLMNEILAALQKEWSCELKICRASPIVSVKDNYDKLRYPAGGASRDARYTRYVTQDTLLRTMASAMVPPALRSVADSLPEDILLVCPGLVYRRDCIDRMHSGEPHQLDLWRIHRSANLQVADLKSMISMIITTVLPNVKKWRLEPRVHPYTLDGLQIDVWHNDEWVEIGECGLAHPEIIAENIPNISGLSGLAVGLGLDRLLMVRKNIPDIRLLRSTDPRVQSQMLDLELYREVSSMPPVIRDISLVTEADDNDEDIGDKVREALADKADVVENVAVLSQTLYADLPPAAIARLGIQTGQKNVLLRMVLRALDRTLTDEECNEYRDTVYAAIHQGSVWQWAGKSE